MAFAYTGATAEVLALAYQKTRESSAAADPWGADPDWTVVRDRDLTSVRFPAIVKTRREHCSHGISPGRVTSQAALVSRCLRHRGVGSAALIEDFIDGREFHVPLWATTRRDAATLK